jgi:hypothetical protein
MKRVPYVAKWCLCILLTLSFVAATGFVSPSADPVPQKAAKKSDGCPNIADLVKPGPDAADEIQAALPKLIRKTYGKDPHYKVWEAKRIISLADPDSSPYSDIAKQQCGEEVANQSWLVDLFFPEFLPSASLSQGHIFVAKTKKGWVAWYRYH